MTKMNETNWQRAFVIQLALKRKLSYLFLKQFIQLISISDLFVLTCNFHGLRMYGQVNWDSKLPKKLHAPVTTYEAGVPDPVRKNVEGEKRPQIWQVKQLLVIRKFEMIFSCYNLILVFIINWCSYRQLLDLNGIELR